MSPRRGTGPRCTVIWWHDIPSQVLVRDGDQTLKAELPARFQHAIDRAAMGGGRAGSGAYMEGWTRSERPCSPDLQAELDAEVAELEQRFAPAELERIITDARAARRRSAPRNGATQQISDQDGGTP
jgi:Virulence factor